MYSVLCYCIHQLPRCTMSQKIHHNDGWHCWLWFNDCDTVVYVAENCFAVFFCKHHVFHVYFIFKALIQSIPSRCHCGLQLFLCFHYDADIIIFDFGFRVICGAIFSGLWNVPGSSHTAQRWRWLLTMTTTLWIHDDDDDGVLFNSRNQRQ